MFDPIAPSRPKKSRKLSVLFPRADETQHTGGINALFLDPERQKLWTASRDSTIKRWDTSQQQPAFEASYEGHIDWVNDLGVVGDLLVSCSNDRTVRMWTAVGPGLPDQACYGHEHSDYITSVATSASGYIAATAGLRGEVTMWDLQKAVEMQKTPDVRPEGIAYQRLPNTGRDSMYAIALDEQAALLVMGTTERLIRVFDWRSGRTAALLRGHADNIRCLQLSQDGRQLLSGSSDHTIRLWDLGQQRCMQTLAVHTDSVWALQASRDFATVISGGRDKCVYRTQLSSRLSELIAVEQGPVLALAWDQDHSELWTGTTAAAAQRWHLDAELPQPPIGPTQQFRTSVDLQQASAFTRQATAGRAFLAALTPLARSKQAAEGGLQPQQQPVASTSGRAPLLCSVACTDRRHVLTADADRRVELWDLLTGQVVRDCGVRALAEVEREVWRPESVPAWFNHDTRLGSLLIHLDSLTIGTAEAYAKDLGMQRHPEEEEMKVNLGERVLRGLLERWICAMPDRRQQAARWEPNCGWAAGPEAAADDRLSPRWGLFRYHSPFSPILMCHHSAEMQSWDGTPWRRAASSLSGKEEEGIMLPTWAVRLVLDGQMVNAPAKLSFYLRPDPASDLPSMMQTKLVAPRILRMDKVVNYVLNKLRGSDSIELAQAPVYWSPAAQAHADQHASSAGDVDELELTCHGLAVPYDLTLAAVKAFVWRRSDDLTLHYSRRIPGQSAQVARIEPPQ